MLRAAAKEPSKSKLNGNGGPRASAAPDKVAVNPVWQHLATQVPLPSQATQRLSKPDDSKDAGHDAVQTNSASGTPRIEDDAAQINKASAVGTSGPVAIHHKLLVSKPDSPSNQEGNHDGRTLSKATRAYFEPLLGVSLGDVRLHTDEAATRSAQSLGALGYTVGNDVVLQGNLFNPGTKDGRRLLGHELAHTIQQRPGARAVQTRREEDGRLDSLEAEADRAGDAMALGHAFKVTGTASAGAPQCYNGDKNTKATVLPTSTLLQIVIQRLEELAASAGAHKIAVKLVTDPLIKEFSDALAAPTQAEADEKKLRLQVETVNDFVTGHASIFASLSEVAKPDNYLPAIAKVIVEEVNHIAIKYCVVLRIIETFPENPKIIQMAIDRANEAMALLPEIIVQEYLGPNGIQKEIDKIRPELFQLGELRSQVHKAPLRGRLAEEIVLMHAPAHIANSFPKQIQGYLKFARQEKKAGKDISNQLKATNLLVQQALGVIYAMQVYEQLDAYVQELDNWINKGIEIFWTEVLGKMRGYRDQVDGIIKIFEDDYTDPEVGYGGASSTRVNSGLNKLTTLVNSAEFKSNVGAAEARMETIAVIRIVGKVIALVALAALSGGVAAEYAAAGAVALGAAEGGLVAGSAAFAANVLAFTAINRAGTKLMFGTVEGSFLGDLATNALMIGVLKGTQTVFAKAFSKFADPKAWKLSYGLGKAATGFVSLQMFAEAAHAFTSGKPMTGEERVRSLIQNAAMMVALEAGGFITEPLKARLTAPALKFKFAARLNKLDTSRGALALRVDSLKRGKLSTEEVSKLLTDLQSQWLAELKLIADANRPDANKKKLVSDAEAKEMVAKYEAAVARIQLQLSKANITAPLAPGQGMFKPLASGVVEYSSKGTALDVLKKFYESNGGKLEPSKTLKEGLEGRLPNGELTFYVPEGVLPKTLPTLEKVTASRDAARDASEEDPMAAAGLAKLKIIVKGSERSLDETLGSVPAKQMKEFLRALADPDLSTAIGTAAGKEFFMGMAGSPEATRFSRRYGLRVLLNLFRRAGGWTKQLNQTLKEVDQRAEANPEGALAFLESLANAKTQAKVEELLGKEKVVKPRKTPVRVTKKSLPVVRGDTWETYRVEAERDSKAHGQTLTESELEFRADCEMFFDQAKAGGYKRYGRVSKLKFLDAFDAVAKLSKMPFNWINAHRGVLSEALFNPDFGKDKSRFYAGKEVKGKTPIGATIPDYKISHTGFTEYVNQKSNIIDRGDKDASGVYKAGKTAAARYLSIAKGKGTPDKPGEATNVPAGDRYSLDFVRDPGPATRQAMLDILFATGSPVYRVKFGETWHTSPHQK